MKVLGRLYNFLDLDLITILKLNPDIINISDHIELDFNLLHYTFEILKEYTNQKYKNIIFNYIETNDYDFEEYTYYVIFKNDNYDYNLLQQFCEEFNLDYIEPSFFDIKN